MRNSTKLAIAGFGLLVLMGAECGGGDQGLGNLPSGRVNSHGGKKGSIQDTVCVIAESNQGDFKKGREYCNGFPKDQVNNCQVGDLWPACKE